jgi:3-phosphoinositide dependent protein kinase-1
MESIQAPPQWPPEVVELYEPLRELGRGGFASVILARNKKSGEFHAIKVVGSKATTRKEMGYALREIDILAETNHPGIMKLIQHWEPPVDARMCAAVMALSYAEGPTLEKLLKLGGKLSFSFSRVVAAQLVDAVDYLHGRAVVHRDSETSF